MLRFSRKLWGKPIAVEGNASKTRSCEQITGLGMRPNAQRVFASSPSILQQGADPESSNPRIGKQNPAVSCTLVFVLVSARSG